MANQNPAQASGIDKFYQKAIKTGFARDFQFRVTRLLGLNLSADSYLLYLNSATLPGRSVSVVNVPYLGLDFRVPGVAKYTGSEGWNVSLKCDESLQIVDYLTELNALAYNDKRSSGSNIPDNSERNTIELVSINGRGDVTRTITLYGAWLTSLGDIQYKLDGNGSLVNIEAKFAYQYWRVQRPGIIGRRPAQPGDLLSENAQDLSGP